MIPPYAGPYLIVFFLLLIFSIPVPRLISRKEIDSTGTEKTVYCDEAKLRSFLSFIILLLFIGFRGYIFTDVVSYYGFYSNLPQNLDLSALNFGWEKGFTLYSLIIKFFTDNYTVYQFVSVLMDLVLLKKCFEIYVPAKYNALAFLLYFCFYGLIVQANLLRNIKSIMLFFIAIQYIGKNFKKYFFIILLACCFHKSSVIYFPLYFILNKKWKRITIYTILLIGFAIYILRIEYLKIILSAIVNFLPGYFKGKVYVYINSSFYNQRYSFGFGFIERFCSMLLLIYFMKIKKTNDVSKYENIFFNIAVIYFSIFLYFSELTIIVERVPYLFTMCYWVCFPLCLKKADKYEKQILIIYIILIAGLKAAMYGNNILSDYKFIFNDDYWYRLHLIETFTF